MLYKNRDRSHRIEVDERQFPELFELWIECLDRAGMRDNPPDFYVEMGGLNAITTGVERPQVIVSSATVSLFRLVDGRARPITLDANRLTAAELTDAQAPSILDTLAEAYILNDEPARARALLERCIELDPTRPCYKTRLDRLR